MNYSKYVNFLNCSKLKPAIKPMIFTHLRFFPKINSIVKLLEKLYLVLIQPFCLLSTMNVINLYYLHFKFSFSTKMSKLKEIQFLFSFSLKGKQQLGWFLFFGSIFLPQFGRSFQTTSVTRIEINFQQLVHNHKQSPEKLPDW